MNIPFFRPSVGETEKTLVNEVLASGWLTTGKYARRFEEAFAQYVGAPYAVALNSCTAGLHLALEACGIERDDAVLVPAMTFAATAEVVRYFDARPVLVDCDPRTLLVDPQAMDDAARIWSKKGRLKAMIPMHYGGQMADMDAMHQIANRHGLRVIEDAAHTLPAFYKGRSVGTTSPLACFSFYANKCITTGEGGMVTTDDEKLAERMRMMSLHGLSKNAWSRFEAKGSWYYEIVEAGFKYNLTDVAAAIGLAQLEKANEFWRQRQAIAAAYSEMLAPYQDRVQLPVELEDRQSSWHLYPIQLHLGKLNIDRAQFIDALKARGITCSVHWMPLHLHPYYVRTYGYQPADLPNASAVWPRMLSLPIFPGMSEAEIRYVAGSVIELLSAHAAHSGGRAA